MKVLSINPHFDKIPLWQQHTSSIIHYDSSLLYKSLFEKSLKPINPTTKLSKFGTICCGILTNKIQYMA